MKPLAQLNVIPFIDIMLVLLAVVLTTATFVAQGKIPVALPAATQAEPISDRPVMEITIDAAGRVYLEDEAMTLDQLDGRLQGVDTTTPLRLRVDAATPFRYFVAVVDRVKARGLANLSIMTRRETG